MLPDFVEIADISSKRRLRHFC